MATTTNPGVTQTEPVTLTAALTAAVNSTLGILAILFEWSSEISNGLLLASGAWITVLFLLLARPQVTPNVNVALTQQENALIQAGKEEAKAEAAAAAAAVPPVDGVRGRTPGV